MKTLFHCCALFLAVFLLCATSSQAASNDTVRRQALMGGVADGSTNSSKSSVSGSSVGNAVPGAAGVKAAGSGMQNANSLYPQPNKPSGGVVNGTTPSYRPAQRQPAPLQAPPAWAQTTYPAPLVAGLEPYGANLFRGNFANTDHEGLQPQYVISPGDRIMLRVWGAFTYDDVLVVDQQGNIFVPEVGPITVGGLSNAQLQSTIKNQI